MTRALNLRLSLFCANICGTCKPGIACDFSCKLVKILGFWQWLFVVTLSDPDHSNFQMYEYTQKKQGGKGWYGPFESKLIFSYGCERSVSKIRDRRVIIDLIRLEKEIRALTDEKFVSEDPWTNRLRSCLHYRVSSGQIQIQSKSWDGELAQKNIQCIVHEQK